ncbi:heavy-metal-associated domain-containing protein [Clostridium sp. P21]|uniref:Heavy-metal-associated domain-containing protein n=1 Tax=Clostridium muellerianum TaxID=2716538 RepID=A0A7Y0ED39_9CLOT|nr:heavy metal-associated domain-containing protein [Clostridium muellerianum]NMM61250.1 heavy-metal-associated domain-containing protein [Clostridium muellerianum]
MKKKLTIKGMSCMHSVNCVHDALIGIPGVISANIDLKTQIVFLESKKAIDTEKIKSTISNIGFEVSEIEKVFV